MGENDLDVDYTLPQVALLTHVWVSAVRLWVRAGKLPHQPGPDGEPRVRRSELARFRDLHGMPPLQELAAAIREFEQWLAVAHPVVREQMLREAKWPVTEDDRPEPDASAGQGRT